MWVTSPNETKREVTHMKKDKSCMLTKLKAKKKKRRRDLGVDQLGEESSGHEWTPRFE